MLLIRILGACALLGLASPALAAPKAVHPAASLRQVLPVTLVPAHYDLHLMPDAERMVLKGEVTVTGAAPKAGRTIVLNAKGLTLDEVRLDGRKAASVAMDDKLGRATLTFAQPFAAGPHKLAIAYHGPIATGTLGVFAMDYDSPTGKRRTLATNLEPTFARSVLPCWDEPAQKATFTVTVDAPADRMALSNMPVAEATPLPGGRQRVRFQQSPRMSTYLLFVGVGDYERIHQLVDGVDVGVVVKRGDTAKAQYALGQATALLHFYNDYFGVAFPLPKLDLIAAPGEIEGGSMENWGAIFYSQHHLLFDPQASTERERQQVFLVVAHEMAHQWFGDLVTMAWWDNLWLNEGFARWMQTHAADALHPEWNTGLQAANIFEAGKRTDAQASTHPVLQPIGSAEQALQAFDSITYDKGAAVITMLESYVGPDRFRDGVRRYMKAHAFGNTTDNDLWSQVQAVAGKPVLAIEHDFTRQPGVPLIRAEALGAGVRLTEGRFAEDPDSLKGQPVARWRIPLAVAAAGQARQELLLAGTATVAGAAPLVNAGGLAYARVAYPPAHAAALAERMAGFSPMDQINLMNDAWALGEAGYAPAANALTFLARLPIDAEPVVWARALALLGDIDHAYPDGAPRAAFRRRALTILAPLAQHLGDAPRPGEAANLTSLRASVWASQSRFGDAAALARARRIQASGEGSIAERRAALDIVAAAADPTTFDALLAQARQAKDPQEKARILVALSGARDPALSARMVEIALGPDAPAGMAPRLIRQAGKENPDAAWAALSPHLGGKLPIDEQDAWNVVAGVAAGSAEPARIADIRAYGAARIPADARRPIESAVGSIKLNQRVRAKALPDIDRWVAGK
ncbi:MAG: Peptidase rane alanine aminopeptidase [Phenylobacterium sp.]|nr:Peptidase rane alanine aminopeptidase [Phenylobacterium sp.]